MHDMPERPERVESVKQTIRNWVNNEYPTSRSLSLKIAGFRAVKGTRAIRTRIIWRLSIG